VFARRHISPKVFPFIVMPEQRYYLINALAAPNLALSRLILTRDLHKYTLTWADGAAASYNQQRHKRHQPALLQQKQQSLIQKQHNKR